MTIANTSNSSYNLITNEYIPTPRPATPRKLFEGEVDIISSSKLLTEDEVNGTQSIKDTKLRINSIT